MIGNCCWSTWESKEALERAIERNNDIGFKATINHDGKLLDICLERNQIMQECLRKFEKGSHKEDCKN